jgi:hypothetical protein
MRQQYEPVLFPVPIAKLRPTQMTVGLREVEQKRAEIRGVGDDKLAPFLGRHMIPVIRGPKDRHYVLDNHHLALALHLEGATEVLVTAVADLSRVSRPLFWRFMDSRNWLHPFDAKGVRQPYDAIPKTLKGLADDPYRSLAGALRDAGGFAKDATPYSEFLWADYLRERIAVGEIRKDFSSALEEALRLSRLPDADYLPGWCRSEQWTQS